MTERWRGKLGDLDKQGPSDDVFDLAKQGPRHSEEPMSGMRTSTRVVTVVAAFAVFALAISVFAIPALRMQGTQAGGGGGGMFPLWPSQTSDQLTQLQSQADAGTATWALDPKGVASAFGLEVLGWRSVTVSVTDDLPCGVTWGAQSSAPYIPQGASASYPGTGSMGPACVNSPLLAEPFGSTPPPRESSLTSSASPGTGSFVRMFITPCAPQQACNVIPLQSVTVYQPLEQGPGQIWAVLQAQDALIKLSTEPGQTVRSGASVSGTFVGGGDSTPTLGYASCGSTAASSETETIADLGERITIQTDLQTTDTCGGLVRGYVWGIRTSRSFADPKGMAAPDPIAGGAYVSGITAVPVVMTLPDQVQTPPPNGGSAGIPPPSAGSAEWQPFTDKSGWTMDVPASWKSHAFSSTPLTGFGGGGEEFNGDELTVDVYQQEAVSMPADDSSYPLDFDTLLSTAKDGALTGAFRGDGQAFSIRVTSNDARFTTEEEAILRQMVASISFQRWRTGEARSGWVSVGEVLPLASAQWITFDGQHFVSSYGPSRALLGPGPECNGATYEIRETGEAAVTCGNGDSAGFDFTTGASLFPGASSRNDLAKYPAVLSWDGQLLVQFAGQRGSTGSPVPTMSPVPSVSPTP